MKLRIATTNDFEIFMTLYEDSTADMIYQANEVSHSNQEYDDSWFEGWDFSYTYKEYENSVARKNILLIEHEKKIIGYFMFFKYTNKKYKFANWAILKEFQYLKEDIWLNLLKFFSTNKKGLQQLEVCLPSFLKTIKWFEDHGFVQSNSNFYSLYLHNQNQKEDST